MHPTPIHHSLPATCPRLPPRRSRLWVPVLCNRVMKMASHSCTSQRSTTEVSILITTPFPTTSGNHTPGSGGDHTPDPGGDHTLGPGGGHNTGPGGDHTPGPGGGHTPDPGGAMGRANSPFRVMFALTFWIPQQTPIATTGSYMYLEHTLFPGLL